MKNKLLALLLAAAAAITCTFGLVACTNESGTKKPTQGLCYTLNTAGTEYSVTGIGTATEVDIVIADTYEGKPVTMIDAYAFANCSELINVTIPDSVTIVGHSAFYGCNKATKAENGALYIDKWLVDWDSNSFEVLIKNDVRGIALYAFEGSWVKSIIISKGVTCISTYAFAHCETLTNVTIPDSVTKIEDYAFMGCIP